MPAVASSPNPHNNGLQSSGDVKEDLLSLMGEKDIVEAELKALGGVLDSVSSLYSSTSASYKSLSYRCASLFIKHE